MRLMFGILAFLLWSGGSGYWYACKIKGACATTDSTSGQLASAESPTSTDNSHLTIADSTSEIEADALADFPDDTLEAEVESFPEEEVAEVDVEEVVEDAPPVVKTRPRTATALTGKLKQKQIVLFSYAKPIIKGRPGLSEYLKDAAAFLMANPGSKAQLVGYTDDTAARENNLKLGQKRAEALADLLRAEGVAEDQLVLESKGEADPIGDNNTRDGRQQNRRVEMQLLDQ